MPITLVHKQPAFPLRWHNYTRPISYRIPRQWHSWLHDKGSLTQRLIQASKGDFAVRVVRNSWGMPSQSEAQALGLKPRQKAIIREVELLCYGEAWVCARSVIPSGTMKGALRKLKDIGDKPLGALLFTYADMRRGPLQVACLQEANNKAQYWARRSVFYVSDRGILVTEVFMPPMANIVP